ncbi:hypothetical protein CIPAW_10G125700, partial [Carya illinoinensis]
YFFQLTKGTLFSSPKPPHKKALYSFSIRLATPTGKGNKERKYIGIFERVLLVRGILPPLDKYILFHAANLFSIFSTSPLQIYFALNEAPKGRPRYFMGKKKLYIPKKMLNH